MDLLYFALESTSTDCTMDRGLELADSLSQRPWCKATLANATAGLKYTYDNLHSLVLACHRRRSTTRRNARNALRKFLSIAPKREHVEIDVNDLSSLHVLEVEFYLNRLEEEEEVRSHVSYLDRLKKEEEERSLVSYLNRLKKKEEEVRSLVSTYLKRSLESCLKRSLESFLKRSLESYLKRSLVPYLKRSLESYFTEEEDVEECSLDPGWFWLWSCLFWVLFSSLCFSLLTSHALAQLLVAVITHRLLSSGDIERNPGPIYRDATPTLQELQYMSYTSADGRTLPFRLMDRIKPRVARLAIALSFPRHIRENLKTTPDPVLYLLDEWLRGANQEYDPSPLTWGTLITALQHAGLMEEVEILEENFVIERPVVDTRASVTISNNEEQMTDKEISETDELPKYKTAQKVNSSSGIVISHNDLWLFLIIMTVAIVLFAMLVYVAVSSAVVPSCPPSPATPPTPPN